jgi:serine/threonine protein kinase
MERAPVPSGFVFGPPPGTRVEDWLLVDRHGQGAFGRVYRALRIGREAEGPVALKMALFPWDPRFMREVGLLSLVHHPSIPRLLGHGFWQHPSGSFFPFIVMEWVEGTPLYAWAREQDPTNLQVLQVLAQLARALEATHARRAVHRDVKGDNILVRRSDGRAVLMDFGVGSYPSAARLTWQPLPPGTPPYRSPEAWLFERRSEPSQSARYLAGPADDVYALGVTAYKLVTGEYPLGPALDQDDEGAWHLEETPLPSPRELNPRVDPQLSALILRMLSVSPEARGTAGALATALEAAAERVSKEGGDSRLGLESLTPSEPLLAPPGRIQPQVKAMSWGARSAWALAGALLVLWAQKAVHAPSHSASTKQQVAWSPGQSDRGTANLGEQTPEGTPSPAQMPSQKERISQDPPPEPFPGQLTPNAKGRCPEPKQIPLNGGCWGEVPSQDAEKCEKNGWVFLKERCYAPAMGSRRKPPPTSAPPDFR